MTSNKRSVLLVVGLLEICLCLSVYAAETVTKSIELKAEKASISGGVRVFRNPTRLGFPEVKGQAAWAIRCPSGAYDLDVVYSAGHAEKGTLLGTIEITVNDWRKRLDVFATGGWGKSEIIPISNQFINITFW